MALNDWLEEQGVKEQLLNQPRANKWTDATIPVSGAVSGSFHLSGATPRIVGPLLPGFLYEMTCQHDYHAESTTDPAYSASADSHFRPANTVQYHIAYSGSSDYVSVRHADGSSLVEFWFSIVEREEGGPGVDTKE